MLIIALLLLGFFVGFQELAIDRPNFLDLMFSSFIFLGAGTFLTIITFAKSSEAEKYLCLGVVIFFIVATLFVANSLAQVPRGGLGKGTSVIPESFTLTVGKKNDGTYVGFSPPQILHSVDYPVGGLEISSSDLSVIGISTQNAVRLNATLIFNLWLLPYDTRAHTQWESVTFGSGQWAESSQSVIPKPIAIRFQEFARYHPQDRVRLEGYYIEFKTGMIVYPADPDLPSSLDFTFNMSELQFSISDVVVDSKFQNGLSITLSGIFIGINCYIPISLVSELWSRKLLEKRMRETETNS